MHRKEKIALLTPGFLSVPRKDGGAIEKLITTLVEQNEKCGFFDIDLYTKYDESLIKFNFNNTNIIAFKESSVERIAAKLYNRVLSVLHIDYPFIPVVRKMARYIRNQEYEKVVVENNMILYRAAYRAQKNKSDYIFHMHNNMYEPGKNKKLADFIAMTAKDVIFVSNSVKDNFNTATSSNRSSVLYNCVNIKENAKIASGTTVAKKKISNFCYAGRICKDKGVEELIAGFNLASLEKDDIKLTIIGFGLPGSSSSYQKKIRRLCKNNKNIILREHQRHEQLMKTISSQDCVIIPSIYEEAFGVIAIEAMSLRMPIIATRAGGLTEMLDSSCALIVPRKGLALNLKKAILKLSNNPKHATELALNAEKKIRSYKNLSEEKYLLNFKEILE